MPLEFQQDQTPKGAVSGGLVFDDAPKPSYGYLEPQEGATSEKLRFDNSGETVSAPVGTGLQFAEIQNDDVFDTPSSSFEEAGAAFEKQAAYIALVANAYGLVGDDDIADFVSDRSRALASAQSRQPEYVKEFNSRWENANGFFEGAGVILTSPRAIGRQVITQAPNSALPLLTTLSGTAGGAAAGSVAPVVGTAAGGIVGGVAGAFVGGAIVEIGAEIDGMMQEAGVDPTDTAQVLRALENESFMESIRIKAERKGLTTAGVDALFQVVGGRFLKAAKVKGTNKIVAGTGDVAIQSVGEGAGEAAGQFAKDGEVNWKDAALEAVTALSQSVGQTAIGAALPPSKQKQQIKAGVDQAVQKAETARQALEIEDIDVENLTPDELNTLANDIDITEAERDQISARAENQIIEIERQEQAEIIAEAQDLKTQIDAIPNADVNKPATLKKVLGYTPKSLSQFIKETGGIVDKAGEFAARGVTTKSGVGVIRKGRGDVQGQGSLDKTQASIPDNENIDFIKERVFDAGYFPDKTDYNEISDSELFDAIASDVQGEKIYNSDDNAKIANLFEGITDQTEQAFFERGINKEMSVEEIANVLREEKGLDEFVQRDFVKGKPLSEIVSNPEVIENVKVVKDNSTGLISGALMPFEKFFSGLGLGLQRALTPISTRIKNISFKLFVRLRKYEYDVKKMTMADRDTAVPFLRKLRKLDDDVRIALDLAMKNGNNDTINVIAEQYNMVDEINAIRTMLDDIYARAEATGVDVNYRADFFPRRVKDVDGLIDHFKSEGYWNTIEEAIRNKEEATGKTLTQDERMQVVNTLMRGFESGGISLAQRGVFKDRSIERVTAEIDKFYETSDQALLAYIHTANEAIETSRLFGKGMSLDGSANIDDSIGAFVDDVEGLSSRNARILKEILTARFNDKKMSFAFSVVRDLSYIDTMGSTLNAITQFGDLATSMYSAGILRTASTIGGAATDQTKLNLRDININDIAQEFDNNAMTSQWVDTVFKFSGLQKIDRIGKLTLVNSTLKKQMAQAKKGDKKFLAQLDLMFDSDAAQVRQDLIDGVMSDDVKFLAFNTLLDFQPVAKSEMPEYYLRTGNLKILYMLKTFTIKQLDIYRREVFAELNQAARTGNAKQAAKAMANFVRLAGFWITMGASADYMKDMLRSAFGGDEMEDPEDYVIDNIFKAFGWSRYQQSMVQKQGPIQVAKDLISPPTKFLGNLERDWKTYKKEGLSLDNSKTIRSIPLGGELYYFWFGAKGVNENSNNDSNSGNPF